MALSRSYSSARCSRPRPGTAIPQRWFNEHRLRNGLVASVYALIRNSPEAQAAAVRALAEKHSADAPHAALLSELGLAIG
jgi:hypothetical protein